MVNMWMVRSGKGSFLMNDFIKKSVVAIGWDLGDLTNKSEEEIQELIEKSDMSDSKNQINRFVNKINVDDYVVSYEKRAKIYFLGKIVSNYYFSHKITKFDSKHSNYPNNRDVEWIGAVQEDSLKKSTIGTLKTQNTVFYINEDAQKDILKVYWDNVSNIENSAKIIKNYLKENNLGNFENKEFEQAFIKFRQSFSPEILKNLNGLDILNNIFLHDGDDNNLCYNLEFSKDYEFAGLVSGYSHKYGLYKSNKTNQWITGSSRKSREVSESEAIKIGEKIRDALVRGAELINNLDLINLRDYVYLENELGNIFSDCATSHLKQWIHKYYVLIFPDKFPVVHKDEMKKDFLIKFNIFPYDWTYMLDYQLISLIKKAEIKGYSLFNEEILNLFGNNYSFKPNEPRNLIYFGAPGTGKSYNLNEDKDVLLEEYKNNYERVTFHPDYSYAHFLGTYKPGIDDEGNIIYEYVPGPFMRTLKNAFEKPDEPFMLIIEEINRANVAAVFGDVFQLLDRNEDTNESDYPINASEDMKIYLKKELGKTYEQIYLPSNLFIWATMNSADQGVFPMDTAFKRRWNFKYFSINHNEGEMDNIKVNINGIEVSWNKLRRAINNELLTYRINEDKLLGPFFAFKEFKDKSIKERDFKEIFKNKVLMYLFEDAAKAKRKELFAGAYGDKNNIPFSELRDKFESDGIKIFSKSIVSEFIKYVDE